MPGKQKQPARSPSTPQRAASSTRQRAASSAAQRAAAQRAVATASRGGSMARNRWWTVGAPIVAVIAVVAVFVAVKAGSGTSSPKSGIAASSAATTVSAAVTSVPASVLNEIGTGSASAPQALTGAALTANGMPRVLYVGAEWCPYCAAERWPLAVALSRFGTLGGLGQVSSSPTDVYPNTATLSFHGATYSSSYVSLTAREIYSNQVVNGTYATLDPLTAADKALFTSVGKGSFPFLDIGGKYLFAASYNPATLAGLTQQQIAADLTNPSSAVAKAIDGAANLLTAAICSTTGNQPSAVCSASGVVAAAAALPRT